MSLGARIRELRLARGFRSLRGLADAADVAYSVLYNIETGATQDPQKGTLERVARALGVSVNDLLDENAGRTELSGDLTWLWRSRFAQMRPSEIMAMRNEPVETRALWCLRELVGATSLEQASAMLDVSRDDLAAILADRESMAPALVDKLIERCQAPVNWVLNGDPGPLDMALRQVLSHPDSGTYLLVILKAIENHIVPELLEQQIDLWIRATKR